MTTPTLQIYMNNYIVIDTNLQSWSFMLIIKFKNSIFFVNEFYVFMFSFTVTTITLVTIIEIAKFMIKVSRKIKRKRLKRQEIKKFMPRGGSLIDLDIANECITQEGIYEIVDITLQQKILRVLNLGMDKVIIIDPHVLILASILTQKIQTRVITAVINTFFNKIIKSTLRDTAVSIILENSGVGTLIVGAITSVIGTAAFYAGVKIVGPAFLIILVATIIRIKASCDFYVRYIEPSLTITGKYVVLPARDSNKIYMKTNENLMIYETIMSEVISCQAVESSSSIERIPNKNSESVISEVCKVKRSYIPLEERTKNYRDIVNYEDSKNRELMEEKAVKMEQKLKVSNKQNSPIDDIIFHE